MTSTRRLAILSQAGTSGGVVVGYRGLTHHEAATALCGLVERHTRISCEPNGMQRMVIRYHLTDEGRRYLDVMLGGAA